MLGTYARSWVLLLMTAAGVVLAAWYTLRLYQGVMNGPPGELGGRSVELGQVGMWVLVPLAALVVVIGIYPAPLLDLLAGEANHLLAGL